MLVSLVRALLQDATFKEPLNLISVLSPEQSRSSDCVLGASAEYLSNQLYYKRASLLKHAFCFRVAIF